jgi:hypothetical protein
MVIAAVFEAGLRTILWWLVLQVAVLVVAIGTGIGLWMWHGFVAGWGAGIAAFVIGQGIAFVGVDMAFARSDRTGSVSPLPSDAEVLEALKAELGPHRDDGAATPARPERRGPRP